MPGGRHRRFQIMGINHFKYATRRESDRLAHRLRTQVVLARRSNTGAASKRRAKGRCPFEFRELNPGWARDTIRLAEQRGSKVHSEHSADAGWRRSGGTPAKPLKI